MIVSAPTLAGRVTQWFGTNPGGYNPRKGHTGEDIALPVGTPLGAMADGVVVHVGYFAGNYWDNVWLIEPGWAGFVVIVDYGSFLSLYCHCSGSPVKVDDRVRRGQIVALSGNTGSATTGPHLHWETMPDGWDYQNGTYGRDDPRSRINTLTPASTTTTRKGLFMALTPAQEKTILTRIEKYLDAPVSAVPKKAAAAVWLETVFRGGRHVSVKQELADAKTLTQGLEAKVAALSAALATVAGAHGGDVDLDAVTAAAEAGAAKALAGLTATLDATVTIEQEPGA
ncbi:lysin A [Arthrobacter phage Whytu]|uniref:Lysin A n=1 Tax=Arthrobacter phage Whytu TaxID=2713260 RepID=A0A6G8R2T2_9CAUD|nr:lysin A [Arthrobacter phage Whytu]QIN94481.1 lysin A [Arthrobacter phage Whytu]